MCISDIRRLADLWGMGPNLLWFQARINDRSDQALLLGQKSEATDPGLRPPSIMIDDPVFRSCTDVCIRSQSGPKQEGSSGEEVSQGEVIARSLRALAAAVDRELLRRP